MSLFLLVLSNNFFRVEPATLLEMIFLQLNFKEFIKLPLNLKYLLFIKYLHGLLKFFKTFAHK